MKLLFFFGGTKIWHDLRGNKYSSGNFTDEVWRRYLRISSTLTIAFRLSNEILSEECAKKSRHLINEDRISVVELPNRTESVKAFLNQNIKNEMYSKLKKEIRNADMVIMRGTDIRVVDLLEKYNKPYLLEVVGCPLQAYWYNSWKGKLFAIPYYFEAKKVIGRAEWVMYVTEKFLQHRYPTRGHSASCSDVVIVEQPIEVLEKRINIIETKKKKMILGTIGALNVKDKGQQCLIKALANLDNKDYVYQLVGDGDDRYLRSLVKRYKLEEQVIFLGRMKHDDIFRWLASIDLYVQPSFDEGLPRALIEAMSMAVPCIGSNVGGIPELISDRMLFRPKSWRSIVLKLNTVDKDILCSEAKNNFYAAKRFLPEILERKRNAFYDEFLEFVNSKNFEQG